MRIGAVNQGMQDAIEKLSNAFRVYERAHSIYSTIIHSKKMVRILGSLETMSKKLVLLFERRMKREICIG